MSVECMDGVSGRRTHDRYTPADYVVARTAATAEDHMCRQCLLDLLRRPEAEWVKSVDPLRAPLTNYDRGRHAEVLALLEKK